MSSKRTFLVLFDNQENIDFNDYFYEIVKGKVLMESIFHQAKEKFGQNPFHEQCIAEEDLLDLEAMKSIRNKTGLVPVVHYYPVIDEMIDGEAPHYYSKRDFESRSW